MEGTVSWAKRDEGRPDLVGTGLSTEDAGTGTEEGAEDWVAVAFTEDFFGACGTAEAALAVCSLGAALGEAMGSFFAGLGAAALATGVFAAAALSLSEGAATVFVAAVVGFLGTVLAGGLALGTAFFSGVASFAGVSFFACVGFAANVGLDGGFLAAAAFFADALISGTGAAATVLALERSVVAGAAGLEAFTAAGATAFALLALALVAFNSCLLTETRRGGLGAAGPAARGAEELGAPSARECTGLVLANPIICKSATNMQPPVKR
jgi:hypothetical protein